MSDVKVIISRLVFDRSVPHKTVLDAEFGLVPTDTDNPLRLLLRGSKVIWKPSVSTKLAEFLKVLEEDIQDDLFAPFKTESSDVTVANENVTDTVESL